MSAFEENQDEDLPPKGKPVLHEALSITGEDIPDLAYCQSMRMTRAAATTPVSSAKKPTEEPKQPSDFLFGKCLGEGAYARVVHAKLKKNDNQFAIKIMEKMHIKKENKVIFQAGLSPMVIELLLFGLLY
jgi:hypothetical protein